MTALIPYTDIDRMAGALVGSKLFGIKDKDQAVALMLVAQAEGLHPATVAVDYDFIQGKPCKKPVAMLRDFIKGGGKVEWHELNDTASEATFSHPQGGNVRVRWDMRKAAQAQLTGKEMWKKYPAAMLRSRCVSEGLRAVFPAATGGLYTPEEVRDFEGDDVRSFKVSPRPEERAPLDRVEAEVQQLLRWVEMRPVPADAIVEWWHTVQTDASLAVGIKGRMTRQYPNEYKVVAECIATAQQARKAAKAAAQAERDQATDAEIVQ